MLCCCTRPAVVGVEDEVDAYSSCKNETRLAKQPLHSGLSSDALQMEHEPKLKTKQPVTLHTTVFVAGVDTDKDDTFPEDVANDDDAGDEIHMILTGMLESVGGRATL